MPFHERCVQDITILDFEGRLTFTAGVELSRRITTLVAGHATKVVLNLERVTYLDSAGLGFIVNAFTQLRASAGGLKFVNPSARTQHVLDITGISRIVETFVSERLAVASYTPAPARVLPSAVTRA